MHLNDSSFGEFEKNQQKLRKNYITKYLNLSAIFSVKIAKKAILDFWRKNQIEFTKKLCQIRDM